MQNVFWQSKNDFAFRLTLSLSWMGSQTRVVLLSQYRNSLARGTDGNKFQTKKIFDGLRFLSAVTKSQMVIKENPRKRPRDPPNSATRDCQG